MLNYNSIINFVEFVYKNFDHIDYLINNACQTINRPREFYEKLLDNLDTPPLKEYDDENRIFGRTNKIFIEPPSQNNITLSNDLNQNAKVPLGITFNDSSQQCISTNSNEPEINTLINYFPEGHLDEFGQQLDLRPINSWILEMDQVHAHELSKVMLINSIAPYILCSNLKKIMTKTSDYSWIVNVSSMEGCFNWAHKSTTHPHTNMAKASLNILELAENTSLNPI